MVRSAEVSARRSLTGVLHELPGPARMLVAANFVSAVGNGLTLPYLAVYLSRVLHFGILTGTLAVTVVAAASLAGGLIAGHLSDAWNRRGAAIMTLAAGSAGSVLLAFTHDVFMAMVGAAIYGLGMGGISSYYAYFVTSVSSERRQTLLGLNFGVMNAGIGLGTLISSSVVDVHHAGTFRVLYGSDAFSFIVIAIAVLWVSPGTRLPGDASAPDRTAGAGAVAGYLAVLRDRRLLALVGFSGIVTAASYGQVSASLPILATGPARVSARVLGLMFLLNTVIVVVAQMSWLRRDRRDPSRRTLVAACLLWAASWLCVTAGAWGAAASSWAGAAGLAVGIALFALAEPRFGPVVATAVNDLAPQAARGRYNSIYGLSTSSGFLLGPVLAAGLLPVLQSGFGLLPAGLCLCAGLAVHRLPLGNGAKS